MAMYWKVNTDERPIASNLRAGKGNARPPCTTPRTSSCQPRSNGAGGSTQTRPEQQKGPRPNWSRAFLEVPPAGAPKDGNRADQRFQVGCLVVQASFVL